MITAIRVATRYLLRHEHCNVRRPTMLECSPLVDGLYMPARPFPLA